MSPTGRAGLSFALKFLVLFALLFAAFEACRGTAVERVLVQSGFLLPAAGLINAISPEEHVAVEPRALVTPLSRLRVTRGCEGIELFVILTAAIVAFPASLKARIQGLLIGGALAYTLSIARLMALHYTLQRLPTAWEALHGLVLPLLPIALLGLYFTYWTAGAAPSGADGIRAT